MKLKSYLLAVSYASEQRYYVEEFVSYFKKKKISIYYDRFEQQQMIGKLLHEKLQSVYTEETLYRIIFLSDSYINKPITKMEAEFILADNIYNKNFLFIFKFDDSNLPGLNPNFVYSDIDDFPNPTEYAKFIYNVIKEKNCHYVAKSDIQFIFEQSNLFFKKIFQDMPDFELVSQIENGLYAIKIFNVSKLVSFFQIGKISSDIFALWLYTYEPLDKDISYNAIIKKEILFDSKQVFTLVFYHIIDKTEREIKHITQNELVQRICQHIMKLIGV